MTRFMLLTGAAALAIGSAATAAAQGKGNGSAKAQQSQRAGNPGKANAMRGQMRVQNRGGMRFATARGPGAGAKAKMQFRGDSRKAIRVARNDRKQVRVGRIDRMDDRRGSRDVRRLVRSDRPWEAGGKRPGVWANGGCPPGLAKKPVACMPPGQVKTMVGQPLRVIGQRVALRQLPNGLRTLYRDNGNYYYRYGDGYVYRVDRQNNLISSLLPLFGLGTAIGQPFPAAYANSYLPAALQSFYPNSPNASYRYANGYVYQVDPLTGIVQGVDPMLGYGYGYGQMMPASYSAYNLPTQYRSLYQDNNNYYYRYAPGSIYRVDAGSGLIDSVAALLMPGGLSVGQPLPMGYDAYNVPYQYRSQYYDTPQNMYRYANGNIYQVDPTTRLVTAIISALI